MLLLQNNKLITVNNSEDDVEVLISKTKEQLRKIYNFNLITKGITYKLIMHTEPQDRGTSFYGKYNFRVIKSQYDDNSSLGQYYTTFDTKGAAIARAFQDGFTVMINDKIVTRDDLK